jgi:hypothetical protein
MLKRIASLTLMFTLVGTVGRISVRANDPPKPDTQAGGLSEPTTPAKTEARPEEKLRVAVNKLLADTKAGKRALPTQPQIQPVKANGLSKNKKIALGVGIAVVVVAVIVVIHAKNHLFDDFNLNGINVR